MKSPANVGALAPFLAGKGGGVSEASSCTVLPFLAGNKGGMSQYSGSLLSLESNVILITARHKEKLLFIMLGKCLSLRRQQSCPEVLGHLYSQLFSVLCP